MSVNEGLYVLVVAKSNANIVEVVEETPPMTMVFSLAACLATVVNYVFTHLRTQPAYIYKFALVYFKVKKTGLMILLGYPQYDTN